MGIFRLTKYYLLIKKAIKKLTGKPDELNILKYCLQLDLTYRPRPKTRWNWHLSITAFWRTSSLVTLSQAKGGCQGFIGPLPSAFLDKCPVVTGCKRAGANIQVTEIKMK